ncbi:MAG: DUF4255 domain-containing protein [Gemmatimonadetes bacterium]|nr:DUF4255 domain-containing protein [Gemmatimonadota bacterium]
MIDEVDRRLKEWITTVLEGVEVTLDPPGPEGPEGPGHHGHGISLYLMEVVNRRVTREGRRAPVQQLALHYLVTAWADDREGAHRILGVLMLEAMRAPEFEVELDPAPVETWGAFGVPPQPSFVLSVPLQREIAEAAAPLVRVAPRVKTSSLRAIEGSVVGPGGVPIAGAVVELPLLSLSTRTDWKGRFRFAGAPAEGPAIRLRVRAKGFTVEERVEGAGPVVITIQDLEG